MVKLYVEGGGAGELGKRCRGGFRSFLEKAGLKGKMPRIVACGSRQEAYDDYSHALKGGESAVLLVDSEEPVNAERRPGSPAEWRPWQHLKQRDGWDKPSAASDTDCHLMVQVMESWLLADPQTLKDRFDQEFQHDKLPALGRGRSLEDIAKDDIMEGLKKATQNCAAGPYAKGKLSFELLGKIDPDKVTKQSLWAKRFIDTLKDKMDA